MFFDCCPKGTLISYIDSEEAEYYAFKEGDKGYFLNFGKYENNFENYLKSFNKKHRKNLNYDLRKLKEKGYIIERNNINNFERLVELNKERFGKDSDYNDKDFVSSIKQLIDISVKKNIIDFLSIKINNKVEAVGLGVFYNNTYYVIGLGRNTEVKNLGKLLISEHIKSAIANKCNKMVS